MTSISLLSCRSCCMLPSLGQLSSLKSLHIENFDGLEFYKNEDDHSSPASPFPSLVDLRFCKMPCWEVWSSFFSDAFPQLKRLEIEDCPRLKGALPNHLPTLETLEIRECQQLILSLPRAPTIRNLWIYKSDKMGLQVLLLSLESLLLGGCQLVESMFQAMSIGHPTCPEEIEISYCPSAISLSWDCLPESLKSLRILNCRKLEIQHAQQRKHGLEYLELRKSCDSLTTFPLEVFPNLERLRIKGCENLEFLSSSESQHAALHRLAIVNCPNFISFPKEGLALAAPNMIDFGVSRCSKLKSLPCHMNTLLPNLETLAIDDCPEIDSFPEGGLPSNLESLYVRKCEKLLCNLSSMCVAQEALTSLTLVDGCEGMKSFPKEGLLPQLPSLTFLCLSGFSNLETLECKELLCLTSLQELVIKECSKLKNIVGERLPVSLWKLEIVNCPLLAERCKNKQPQIWPQNFQHPWHSS